MPFPIHMWTLLSVDEILLPRYVNWSSNFTTQLAGAIEHTNCISAEGCDRLKECPGYDTKQSDGESPVMLEHWGMRRTPSLPSLRGPLWLRVVPPDRVLSMSQIELFDI